MSIPVCETEPQPVFLVSLLPRNNYPHYYCPDTSIHEFSMVTEQEGGISWGLC
jgi:hypothetical protein